MSKVGVVADDEANPILMPPSIVIPVPICNGATMICFPYSGLGKVGGLLV
jgi:hypothetical protein